MRMRHIVLDTETTGLEVEAGHRIIEIGCVELVNRRLTGRHFHVYLNPERAIDAGAIEVHGITDDDLADKPRFADIAEDFLAFLGSDPLVIHNAPFDVGFLNRELTLANLTPLLEERCEVIDTLALARRLHPGQKNSLDALCRRYEVDNSQRELHGALLDAQILADVYLAMTGGQVALSLDGLATSEGGVVEPGQVEHRPVTRQGRAPRIIRASDAEREAHARRLEAIEEICGGPSVWRRVGADAGDRDDAPASVAVSPNATGSPGGKPPTAVIPS
jgi:DNA polymerase-3 subunit epsilon